MRSRLIRQLCVASIAVLTLAISPSAPRPAALKLQPVASTGAWTQYHHDDAHTGTDTSVPTFTGVTTGWTSAAMDGEVFAEPLIVGSLDEEVQRDVLSVAEP